MIVLVKKVIFEILDDSLISVELSDILRFLKRRENKKRKQTPNQTEASFHILWLWKSLTVSTHILKHR